MEATLSFWGKTFGRFEPQTNPESQSNWKPALHHMLDVAAVAHNFICLNAGRARREARALNMEPSDYARLVAFLAGLHDLGKFTRNFQIKRPDLWWPAVLGPPPAETLAGPPHWRATARLLRHPPIAERFRRYAPNLASGLDGDLIAAIAGHHGRPPDCQSDNAGAVAAGLADGRWIDAACVEAATRAFSLLEEIISPAFLPLTEASEWSWRLAGLITLADWVGSDADFFGPCDIETSLPKYWREALRNAESALIAKGLVAHRPLARPDLAAIAPRAAATPRPMQALVAASPVAQGPQLHLIEDSTGSGKTEAALLLAARLLAEGRGEGIFIALPTMATANAMHARLKGVVSRLFPAAEASLVLAHGKASLAKQLANLHSRALGDGEATTAEDCNAWIADDRRRVFFADIGAGTIDQAFLSVLPKKYLTLRQYGLAGRVLIIDEAHCFDAYMKEELDALIRLHAMNGGSTIVLSATLSLAARRKMAAAFYRGVGLADKQASKAAQRCAQDHYPLLTSVDRDSLAERPSRLAAELARNVDVVRLANRAAAVDAAIGAADKGAAVLVIANAVDECIALHETLAIRWPADKLHLFHARFTQGDRIAIEDSVLARFGRESAAENRAGHILVATQVVEQSLDLDFDLVISDLAPIDLIIQRAGRLWRQMDNRPRATRPVEGPTLMVVSPDPEAISSADWLGPTLGKAAGVYQDAGVVWRSARTLFRAGHIQTPDDLRPMIEAVYGDEAEPTPEILQRAVQRGEGKNSSAKTLGAFNVVALEDGYEKLPSDLRQDETIGTRLGEPTVTLRLARRVDGELVPWFASDSAPIRLAWALSEVTLRKALWGDAMPRASDEALRQRAMRDWTEWEKSNLIIEVHSDGRLSLLKPSFEYDSNQGLKKV